MKCDSNTNVLFAANINTNVLFAANTNTNVLFAAPKINTPLIVQCDSRTHA